MATTATAATQAGVAEGRKLLSVMDDMLAKKDVAMGDLLQLMVPETGKEGEVDACSDAVEALQTDLDKSVSALRQHLGKLKDLVAALPDESALKAEAIAAAEKAAEQHRPMEAEHKITATRTGSGAGADPPMDRGDRDEVASLRASLHSATMREKERVEALQAQLEIARHELSDSRSGRRLEQSSLVTAESQATQLRTALACAEEDMKALRDALDQELLRGHRLQSRLMDLDHTLHTHSLRENAVERSAAPSRGSVPNRGNGGGHVPPLEGVAFDDYMSGRRQVQSWMGSSGSERRGARPASAKIIKGGGARAVGGKPRPVSAGGNTNAQYDGHVSWRVGGGVEGQMRGEGVYRGSPAMDVVISNRQTAATDELRTIDPASGISKRPAPSSPLGTSAHNISDASTLGATSTAAPPPSKHGADSSAFASKTKKKGSAVDNSSLAYLRTNVVSGHVTKTSHLELRVEYCGRNSFSVRHKEGKYNLLAEQVKAAAFDRFKDRWMTVIACNGEAAQIPGAPFASKLADNGHKMTSARLGAFEMELFWTDSTGKKRGTVRQCVAVCCSVLQCFAVCCSVLQCVAVCCSVLQCVSACYRVVQCGAVCFDVLQCVAVWCSALQ